MYTTSESESRYLSLAIAAHHLINGLLRYQQTGVLDQKFKAALQTLIGALYESVDQANLFGPMPTDSPFTRYEQVLILKELNEEFRDKRILEKLSALLQQPRQDVKEPIEFFYALENKALHHYNSGVFSRES